MSEENLASLIKKQEYGFRSMQVIYDLSLEAQKDKKKVGAFRARFKNIDNIRDEFINLTVEINALTLKLNPKSVVDMQRVFAIDDIYYQILEISETVLTSGKALSAESVSSDASDSKSRNQSGESSVGHLPRIELPKFDGNVENWPTFRDTFLRLVHDNKSLSNIEKFHFLISCLSGPALSIAKGLPITDSNYPVAYDSLFERYQNDRLIAATYLDKIYNFVPLKNSNLNDLSRLVNVLFESVNALKQMKIDNLGDFILFYLSSRALDLDTRKRFELQNKSKIPNFDELLTFLKNYVKILETSEYKSVESVQNFSKAKPLESVGNNKGSQNRGRQNYKSTNFTTRNNTKTFNCQCCNQQHSLYICDKFKSLDYQGRLNIVNTKSLCSNCLRPRHSVNDCYSKSKCSSCGGRHHSLLHSEQPASVQASEPLPSTSSSLAHLGHSRALVLLGTCIVRVSSPTGDSHLVRALIDSGAQDCFITAACAQRLALPMRRCNISVSGVGQNLVHQVRGVTSCTIRPQAFDEPRFNIQPIVLTKITSQVPLTEISSSVRENYKHLILADNDFDKPSDVDLLLGAEMFHDIYDGLRVTPQPGLPTALHSVFGWVLTGKLETNVGTRARVTALVSSTLNLEDVVKRFWEVEEPPRARLSVPEEDECEKMYINLVSRDMSGRYIVPILLKQPSSVLGSSFKQGFNRLVNLERRLARHDQLKIDYVNFMREYASLGHMQPAKDTHSLRYVIPHHCVIRPESTTTRLRVVFDASAKTNNGLSLNDIVHIGPKLQADIVEILTKFRLHSIVFTADISKMYRNILLRPEDRHCQHVLWRDLPSDSVTEYELNTVTYGVSSSPYLAIRTLRQLADDEGSHWPRAAEVLRKDVFMDDTLTGAPSVGDALELKDQLVGLLNAAQFELRKWSSNSREFLAHIPSEHCQSPKQFCEDSNQFTLKILGVQWDPSGDYFTYSVSNTNVEYTKRSILSHIARIYDPVGWLTPMILLAKLLIQNLWRIKLDWDDNVPRDVAQDWEKFLDELNNLKSIRLPRLIVPPNAIEFKLIGFCDGSTKAYGCVVYLRAKSGDNFQVNLLIAKSKVAPLKPLTVNRLELCGAVLLARVLKHMHTLLRDKLNIVDLVAFTDSSCVLSWLHTEPYKLKTFVAHRVVVINDLVEKTLWRHVSTHDNPADFCSRGLSCSQLAECHLWWSGPSWLINNSSNWPVSRVSVPEVVPELKTAVHITILENNVDIFELLLEKYSSFKRVQRILAWIRRYLKNCKLSCDQRLFNSLTSNELQESHTMLIKYVQYTSFSSEIEKVKSNSPCGRNIQKLFPFLDSDGILRVGGRLKNSNLSKASMHPILLPKRSRLSSLIVDHFHLSYLHCGPRALQSLIQRKYWILGVRNLIRSRLSKCVVCFKVKPTPCQPIMGDLPVSRLEQARCFQNIGIDFGGPFFVKESKRRNAKSTKAYICLFVCLSTRAIHLELVSELSTEAFIAALDRFVARRGLCRSIVTDCGTNFVGSKRYLNEMYQLLSSNQQSICNNLVDRSIAWKFNPPGAPHFGGIFESGIKSTKYHLKRVIGTQILTYEEFTTILSKVEAMLNSRPLCALSSDPTEVDVLTAGHFIIGGPLVALPEAQMRDAKLPLRSRWQLLQKLTQSFWRSWQRDYLHTLQQRSKWFSSNKPNLSVGDLVIIIEPNLAPLEWRIGRVEQVHPGADNIVRVVTLRTTKGTLKRPVVKVCPLPIAK